MNEDQTEYKVLFSKKIITFPKILIIILDRKKLNIKISYNDTIDLSKFSYKKYEVRIEYKLVGVSLINSNATHAISRCINLDGNSCIFNDLKTKENYIESYDYSPYILFYEKNY